MSAPTAQPFLRWLLGLMLGSEGSRKHVLGMYALTLIYAAGVQAGAPEWVAEWLTYAALGVAGANVGEHFARRRRASAPTPAAGDTPIPASPAPAAGAGASAP